jgi:site-specific DNA recombinase
MKKKQFIALARVSSREQEREGFSLDIQVDALNLEAERRKGKIIKLWRIAETASKTDERKTFKELIAFAKKYAAELDGILFYKIDRAARNLFDYVELERLESEFDVPFFSVTQPTENTPAGRMQRRMLASMASFYTEQQSLDVKGGVKRRVEEGLFPQKAPYGYRNIRVEKRGLVEVHPVNGPKVTKLFDLYAYHHLSLDGLQDRLYQEGIHYRDSVPRFPRSKLYAILKDRAYIGDVKYQGQWHPGTHKPLVDRVTFDKVQVLLGEKVYRSHELTYAGGLIQCKHCNAIVTGESVVKKTTGKEYVYYRCSQYNAPGHPRVRLNEEKIDRQILAIFDTMRIEQADVREWFVSQLRVRTSYEQEDGRRKAEEIQRQLSLLRQQQDRLLNLRLMGEIDERTMAEKATELRDRVAMLKLQLDACDLGRDENAEIAVKAFELSQNLRAKWLTADYSVKRRYLEIVFLNFVLDDVTLVPTTRKPFDMVAEGLLVSSSRGDWIRTSDLLNPIQAR